MYDATVNSKWITSSQIVEIVYEGRVRQFGVTAISGAALSPPLDDALPDIGGLHLDSKQPRQIWTVGWDVVVQISEPQKQKQKERPQGVDADVGVIVVNISIPIAILVVTRVCVCLGRSENRFQCSIRHCWWIE